ncbi:hypothetical protein [Actinoplanes sp. NPDC020271]|uniref:hypothetical protein n=1 Tax=Actinoplanes sp. NPDC020271 TaxID=3363896 RepID=UPI00378F0587
MPESGPHAEMNGARGSTGVEQPAPVHSTAREPVAVRSGVVESGLSSGMEPARSGVRETGFSHVAEPGRAEPQSSHPAEIARGEARAGEPRTEGPGRGPSAAEAPGSDPTGREPGRDTRSDRADQDRADQPDSARRRSPEQGHKRWRDYTQRIQRWAESRAGDRAAMERALARRFEPDRSGEPRLTPETVQRILDRPAQQLDATGRRFREMVRDYFSEVRSDNGEPARHPASEADIARKLDELARSRPPSPGRHLLNISALRGPDGAPIHSDHVIGGEYHGFGREADPALVRHEVHDAVPKVLDRLFKDVEFVRGDQEVLRIGGERDIRVSFDARHMDRTHVGESQHFRRGGGRWQVEINAGTAREHVTTVTSHEIAEILHTTDSRPGSTKDVLTPDHDGTGELKLSPDDLGRIGEMLDLHQRALAGDHVAGDRLGELLDHLDLRDGPGAAARRETVTGLLDDSAAHHFADKPAGQLSDLLKRPHEDLPQAPERTRYRLDDLQQHEGREPGKLTRPIYPEAHQQTGKGITPRYHAVGDPRNTFRIENGTRFRYTHTGKVEYAHEDYGLGRDVKVPAERDKLADLPHPPGSDQATRLAAESTLFHQQGVDLAPVQADRLVKLDRLNSALDDLRQESDDPNADETYRRRTESDFNAENREKTEKAIDRLIDRHPELQSHADDVFAAGERVSTALRDRNMTSNRAGMIAGREYATSLGVAEGDLHGDVTADPKSGELDVWGVVRDADGHVTELVVVEAKGGTANLGKRDGNQQGTGPYLRDIMSHDKVFLTFLAEHPAIGDGLRSGAIPVEYYQVGQPHMLPGGSAVPAARVYRFEFRVRLEDGQHPGDLNVLDPRSLGRPGQHR